MPAFLVKQKLVTDVSGNVRRVYKESHTANNSSSGKTLVWMWPCL
jgi:hypothetical protein